MRRERSPAGNHAPYKWSKQSSAHGCALRMPSAVRAPSSLLLRVWPAVSAPQRAHTAREQRSCSSPVPARANSTCKEFGIGRDELCACPDTASLSGRPLCTQGRKQHAVPQHRRADEPGPQRHCSAPGAAAGYHRPLQSPGEGAAPPPLVSSRLHPSQRADSGSLWCQRRLSRFCSPSRRPRAQGEGEGLLQHRGPDVPVLLLGKRTLLL